MDRLRLAHGDLAPRRAATLLGSHDPSSLVQAIGAGAVVVGDRARTEIDVPAVDRLAQLRSMGITFVPGDDSGLPPGFDDLGDPPIGLFVKGSVPPGPAVAVVGTRRCTAYGRKTAREIGAILAGLGVVVVSGLARGIDGAAHAGTVAAGGSGVAVLGCGIDRWYPPEHRDLGRDLIAGGGAVVSEYPPGRPPEPWRFPVRNRLIAAWSQAVVVVEAGATGGALITARLALELGREVFAVPGDIDREASRGCNELIRDGAHPLIDPDQLAESLGFAGVVRPHRAKLAGDEVAVAELVERDGRPAAEVLADLSRRQATGEIEIVDGMVRVV